MSTTPVSRDAVSSAVAALGKWMHGRSAASKPQLLLDDRDDFFVLLLSLRRIPSNCRTNPFFLPIPHPIFPLSDPTLAPSVFLIIDDRAADSPPPSKFLEEAKECNLPISEVIGISTLRTDYRAFESRRKLCGSHDLFLADKKILPLLPRLLGKSFFQKKKNPLPVNFSRVGWKDQIKRILNSTYFYLRSGTCCAIRVGRLAMEAEQVVDNVMAAIDEAVEKIPKKWGNVRSLNLKAVDSVALPIYQAVPEIGLKIEVGEREDSGAEELIDGNEVVVKEKSEKKKKRKKKAGERENSGAEEVLDGHAVIEEKGEKKKRKKKGGEREYSGAEEVLDGDAVIEEKGEKKKRKKKGGERENSGAEEVLDGDAVIEEKSEKKKGKKKGGERENSGAEEVLDGDAVTGEKSEKKKGKKKGGIRYTDGVPLAGEELVEGDGEDKGEKEKNKKRKKRVH